MEIRMSAPGFAFVLTVLQFISPISLCFGNVLVCGLSRIFIIKIFEYVLFDQENKFHYLCSTMKEVVSQLASHQPSKWTLKLFLVDSTNLSGSGTVASWQGSVGGENERCLGK